MARRALLRTLRQRQDEGSPQCRSDALLVLRLPQLLQRTDRHFHHPIQRAAAEVGHCHLPVSGKSQERVQHEAPRDIGVSQKTAWFMLMRIREAWAADACGPYSGPVEFDEAYFGGKRKNMSNAKRRELSGRGPVGKTAVVGAKDRASNQVAARVVQSADADTLQGFVTECTLPGATVYTDDATAFNGVQRKRESVKHSVGEHVRDQASTNGIESFWSMLKRAHKGTFHKLSPKHLDRYVRKFGGRHNMRDSGMLDQMRHTVARLMGRNLLYRDLVADSGRSTARASFSGVAPARSRFGSSMGFTAHHLGTLRGVVKIIAKLGPQLFDRHSKLNRVLLQGVYFLVHSDACGVDLAQLGLESSGFGLSQCDCLLSR